MLMLRVALYFYHFLTFIVVLTYIERTFKGNMEQLHFFKVKTIKHNFSFFFYMSSNPAWAFIKLSSFPKNLEHIFGQIL